MWVSTDWTETDFYCFEAFDFFFMFSLFNQEKTLLRLKVSFAKESQMRQVTKKAIQME